MKRLSEMNQQELCELLMEKTSLMETPSMSLQEIVQWRQIEKKYGDSIKYRADTNQYYVIIKRKQITCSHRNGLLEKLRRMEYSEDFITLADYYPGFMLWKRDFTSTSGTTLKFYDSIWNGLLNKSHIVYMPIEEIQTIHFMNYFRMITMSREMSRKRFNNIKTVFNELYSYLIENGVVQHNPIKECNIKHLCFKPISDNSNEVFTIKEREILIAYLESLEDDIYSLAILLDFCLIVRIGELTALRYEDINDDYIHIRNQHTKDTQMDDDLTFSSLAYTNHQYLKGYKSGRTQFLIPKAKEILKKIKEINPDGKYILMCNGKQLSSDKFNKKLKGFCRNAGVRELSSHKIRFSNASLLHAQGMTLPELQKLLGHSSQEMTLYYLRNVVSDKTTNETMKRALE